MEIGAVIVNHNAGASLSACVESLHGAGLRQIVIIDNDSTDDSLAIVAQIHPEVTVVSTGKNPGYGSAVNHGRQLLSTEFLFICNPDLEVDERAPGYLVSDLLADPQLAIVGPEIQEISGAIYPSSRAFPRITDAFGHAMLAMFWPSNRFSRRYRREEVDPHVEVGSRDDRELLAPPLPVDWVSGAAMMARTSAFDQVSGFDEGYFMYVEDLDLCWRLHAAGWGIGYEPRARVVHQGGLSSRRHPYRMLRAHHASTWRFARRSLKGPQRLLLPLIGAGIIARFAIASVRQAVTAHA